MLPRYLLLTFLVSGYATASQQWIINEFSEDGEKKNTYNLALDLNAYDSFGNDKLDNDELDPNLKKILDGCVLLDDLKKSISLRMNRLRLACKKPDELKITCDFYPIPDMIGLPNITRLDQTRNIKRMEITGCTDPMPETCSINLLKTRKYVREIPFQRRLEKCAEALAEAAHIQLTSPIDRPESHK